MKALSLGSLLWMGIALAGCGWVPCTDKHQSSACRGSGGDMGPDLRSTGFTMTFSPDPYIRLINGTLTIMASAFAPGTPVTITIGQGGNSASLMNPTVSQGQVAVSWMNELNAGKLKKGIATLTVTAGALTATASLTVYQGLNFGDPIMMSVTASPPDGKTMNEPVTPNAISAGPQGVLVIGDCLNSNSTTKSCLTNYTLSGTQLVNDGKFDKRATFGTKSLAGWVNGFGVVTDPGLVPIYCPSMTGQCTPGTMSPSVAAPTAIATSPSSSVFSMLDGMTWRIFGFDGSSTFRELTPGTLSNPKPALIWAGDWTGAPGTHVWAGVTGTTITAVDCNGAGTACTEDGTLSSALTSLLGTATMPLPAAVASGDLNGDGIADLVVMQNATTTHVLLSRGGATTMPYENDTLTLPPGSSLLSLGDVSGGGVPDLAVAMPVPMPATSSIAVLVNNNL